VDMPGSPMEYNAKLLGLNCFDAPIVSAEDAQRAKMYASERKRANGRANIGSVDDWLKSLDMKVVQEELNDANLQRMIQLLNKTNQMNLSTRRMSETEFAAWAQDDRRRAYSFRVSDKYGDSGLTGIVSLEMSERSATVVDFILSCRVMGRRIEETMLHAAARAAQQMGAAELSAKCSPTDRNKPCLDFLLRSGMAYDKNSETFTWSLDRPYPLPDAVRLERRSMT